MKPREEWHLDTRHLGRRVLVFDQIDSTNTYAAQLADDPANEGIVILADAQTAGRGQLGRRWQCPPGEGILLSTLLFPPPPLRRPVLLAAWAAVSVCETIRQSIGLPATIKWPNDVLIRGRKVCGVLIEQRSVERGAWSVERGREKEDSALSTQHSALSTVCGIGLNVNQSAETLAAAGLPQAGSLALCAERPLDRSRIARILIEQLDREYDLLCRGEFSSLESRWIQGLELLGREVAVECHGGIRHGRLREMSFAEIILEAVEDETVRLRPETVKRLSEAIRKGADPLIRFGE